MLELTAVTAPRFSAFAKCLHRSVRAHLVRILAAILLAGQLGGLDGETTAAAGEASELHPARASARPRIGLALGGGGARGLAHIGVIRWLEEHHIPTSAVAGSSTGAVVGGIFAMGKSPQELHEIVGELSWDEVFDERAPYPDAAFRRKEDAREYQVEYQFGLYAGLALPTNAAPAHTINFLLDRLALPYGSIESFDELPIPFRSVTVDIETGEEVVLESGWLPLAMRASMAVPGIFTPVEVDGRLLVDGGLLDNVPTDVVRRMGGDVVIAVDVAERLKDRSELKSAFDYTNQAITVMMLDRTRSALAKADVVITPDLGERSAVDFKAVDEIVNAGYRAAEAKAALLAPLALDDGAWDAYVAARRSRVRTEVPVPTDVAVEGDPGRSTERVREALEEFRREPVDPESVEQEITAVLGTGRYETIHYAVRSNRERAELLLIPARKRFDPPVLRLGLRMETVGRGLDMNLDARMVLFDFGFGDGEGRFDAGVGDRLFARFEYYQPFSRSGFFVAPRIGVDSHRIDLFRGSDRVAEYGLRESELGFDVGLRPNRLSEIRFGYELDHIRTDLRLGEPRLTERGGLAHSLRLRYAFDRTDDPLLPSSGVVAYGELRRVFDSAFVEDSFWRLETAAAAFVPVRERDIAFVALGAGTSFDADVRPPFDFALGGPFRLGALKRDEVRGDHFVYASPGYFLNVGTLPEAAGRELYVGAWYEVGSAFGDLDAADFRSVASVGLAAKTRLGLLLVGASYGEHGRGRLYVSLGRIFP